MAIGQVDLRTNTSNLVIIQAQNSHVCMNRVKIDYANVPTQNGYKKAVLVLVLFFFTKTASARFLGARVAEF